MWPDICRRIPPEPKPEPEPHSVMTVPLLYMLMICMKLRNLRINCSVLMSVILIIVFLLHNATHNTCLFECQLIIILFVHKTVS